MSVMEIAGDTGTFSVSSKAAKRVLAILETEPDKSLLRVSVLGGGCSGFQYKFDLERTPQDDDVVIEKDGATIIVDPMSLEFLGGAELDYVEDLIGSSFQIQNPNAKSSCGCGTSFSI